MARPLRIEFPGALYHVMSRGNERQDIVRDEADCEKRLEWLERTVVTYGWRLHAFVLMTNHEHPFVETPEANLSAGMQFLNGSYTGYFNRRYGRAGTFTSTRCERSWSRLRKRGAGAAIRAISRRGERWGG